MSNSIPKIEELKESFARVYDGPDRLRREYDIVVEAERLNMPLDTYRDLYQYRSEEPIDPYPQSKSWQQVPGDWANWFKHLPIQTKKALFRKGVVQLVQSGVAITIVFALTQYIWDAPARKKQTHYQAWQIINSAKGHSTNAGRNDALQDLNQDGVSLRSHSRNKADWGGKLVGIQLLT